MTAPGEPSFGARRDRRGFLVLGGAAVVMLALPNLASRFRGGPELAPHPRVAGFRQADAAEVSGGFDPFAGLDTGPATEIPPAAIPDICAALFRDNRPAARVPVAFFTDIACPHCRAMEPAIAALPEAEATVHWHDLPRLGPASVMAARAIAAARAQDAERAMRARLTRSRFRADAAYVTALATGLGLDADRLIADMAAPATEARIAQTLGLARAFGFPGTPALVVGDIAAVGRREPTGIDALIAASAAPPCS